MADNGISMSNLLALTQAVNNEFPIKGFIETFNYSSYPLFNKAFNDSQEKGGRTIDWTIRTGTAGNAERTRLYDNDSVNIENNVTQATMNMVVGKCHWGWDRRENALNSGSEMIFSLVNERKSESVEDMAELVENDLLDVPNQTVDNDLFPWGIPSHLCMGPTGAYEPGFVGQTIRYRDGGSATSWLGLDRGANERLRNWSFIHNNKVDQAFIRNCDLAMRKTKFNPPMRVEGGVMLPSADHVCYTGDDMYQSLFDWFERNGNNVGLGNSLTLKGISFVHAEALNPRGGSDSSAHRSANAMYFVQWPKWKMYFTTGFKFKESEPILDPNSHNRVVTWYDWLYNLVCMNAREGGFVAHAQLA